MLFDHRVRPDWVDRIPAAIHLDGTARLQTVSAEDNPMLAAVLREYHKWSGIPVLCNTSANYNGRSFFPDVVSAMELGQGRPHLERERPVTAESPRRTRQRASPAPVSADIRRPPEGTDVGAPRAPRAGASVPYLWLGDLAARSAHQITAFGLPLLVVTLLAGSGTQVGLVGAAQFVPVLAFSLLVGTWTARTSLRWILVTGNAARGVVLFGIGALAATDRLVFTTLLVGAFLIGSAAVLHDIGSQDSARLLDGDRLVAGNGLLQATTSVTQMAGLAAAGFIVQSAGAAWAAVVTGALFCAAAMAMAALPARALRPATDRATRRRSGPGWPTSGGADRSGTWACSRPSSTCTSRPSRRSSWCTACAPSGSPVA